MGGGNQGAVFQCTQEIVQKRKGRTCLGIDYVIAVIYATSQHLLAECHYAGWMWKVPCLVVPHLTSGATTRLHFVNNEIRTGLLRKHKDY